MMLEPSLLPTYLTFSKVCLFLYLFVLGRGGAESKKGRSFGVFFCFSSSLDLRGGGRKEGRKEILDILESVIFDCLGSFYLFYPTVGGWIYFYHSLFKGVKFNIGELRTSPSFPPPVVARCSGLFGHGRCFAYDRSLSSLSIARLAC